MRKLRLLFVRTTLTEGNAFMDVQCFEEIVSQMRRIVEDAPSRFIQCEPDIHNLEVELERFRHGNSTRTQIDNAAQLAISRLRQEVHQNLTLSRKRITVS